MHSRPTQPGAPTDPLFGASAYDDAARQAEDSPFPATDPGPFDDDAPAPLERGPATPLPPAPRPGDRVAPYAVVAALIVLTLLTAWWSSSP